MAFNPGLEGGHMTKTNVDFRVKIAATVRGPRGTGRTLNNDELPRCAVIPCLHVQGKLRQPDKILFKGFPVIRGKGELLLLYVLICVGEVVCHRSAKYNEKNNFDDVDDDYYTSKLCKFSIE